MASGSMPLGGMGRTARPALRARKVLPSRRSRWVADTSTFTTASTGISPAANVALRVRERREGGGSEEHGMEMESGEGKSPLDCCLSALRGE